MSSQYLGEFSLGKNSYTNKLEEAKFFLEKMRETSNKDSIKEFKFYFSAFISAARSTTWVLKKTLDKKEWFNDWYAKKQVELQPYEFMVDIRDETIHEGGQVTKRTTSVTGSGIKKFELHKEKDALKPRLFDMSGHEIKPAIITKTWFFRNKNDKPLFEYCFEYVSKLEAIIKEANALSEQ